MSEHVHEFAVDASCECGVKLSALVRSQAAKIAYYVNLTERRNGELATERAARLEAQEALRESDAFVRSGTAAIARQVEYATAAEAALRGLLNAVERHEAEHPDHWLDYGCQECVGPNIDTGAGSFTCARHVAAALLPPTPAAP